jgi:CDP-paratose 2-epimerase
LPITVYGDGLQVRDALYVDDAVAAWLRALDRIEEANGRIFNLGGGVENSLSLRELLHLIETIRGERPRVSFAPWRPGDQPWYVSDNAAISAALGWRPQTSLRDGIEALHSWLVARFGAAQRALAEARA